MTGMPTNFTSSISRPQRLLENLYLIAGRLLPVSVTAWVMSRYIPLEVARDLATKFPPARAALIADALPSEYLASLSLSLNAEQARYLLPEILPGTASRIAKLLVDRREFVAMSRLVAYLAPASMARAVSEFHSAADLLKVAMEVDEKSLLSPAVAGLPSQRLGAVLLAAEKGGHWQEIFDLMHAMDASTQGILGERLAELPAEDITGLLHASLDRGTWPELLQICLGLSEHAQLRLAEKISLQDEELHLRFMLAAKEIGKMQLLLKLVGYMPMPAQRRLVRLAGRHGIRITSAL